MIIVNILIIEFYIPNYYKFTEYLDISYRDIIIYQFFN